VFLVGGCEPYAPPRAPVSAPSRRAGVRPAMTSSPDVVVVGGGLVGLACALALVDRGAAVALVAEVRAGAASPASAGILGPSLGEADPATRAIGLAARDRFPRYIEDLRAHTGAAVALDREGILDVALEKRDAERLLAELPAGAEWVDGPELRRLEPALSDAAGAVLLPHDGAVDNVALLDAMQRCARATARLRRVEGAVVRIEAGEDRGAAIVADGSMVEGSALVLAAGAWTGAIGGVPRRIPVVPVRGQILVLGAAPLRHVVHADEGYLVPRGGDRTLVGSTSEDVGFDASTTAAGIAALARVATRLCPSLVGTPPVSEWAGLRPMTPDGRPLIGREPRAPALVYAAGHSRNGVLLAPLTGDCVAALLCGESPPVDLSLFAPDRFGG
jgi:glycine oxidase